MVAAQMIDRAREAESLKSLATAMGVPGHVLARAQRGSYPTPIYGMRIAAYFGKHPRDLWADEPIQRGEN